MANKQPIVRFSEFQNDWENRKLDSIYGRIKNAFVGTATPYYVENGHFYLESNNVKNGQINRNTEVFINDEFYEKQKDNWLHTGDLVMVQSGHVGHTAVIPKELDNTAAHALIMFSNYKENASPYFLNYQFQTNSAKKKLDTITTGNTIKHILSSEMKKFPVFIPTFEEQSRIGSFFKQLDDTIALHQQELDILKQTKQGFLQKMFPKEGESVPKVRFPGFGGKWNECCLEEKISSERKGKAKAEMLGSASKYLETGYLNGGDCLFVDSLADVNEDDVIILWDGSQAGTIYHGFEGALGSTLKAYQPKESGAYLYQFLKSKQDEIYKKYRTPNIPHVVKTFTKDFIIMIPSWEEQVEIGSFFKQLDDTIDLQQRELDALKETKKAFLQKMFI